MLGEENRVIFIRKLQFNIDAVQSIQECNIEDGREMKFPLFTSRYF